MSKKLNKRRVQLLESDLYIPQHKKHKLYQSIYENAPQNTKQSNKTRQNKSTIHESKTPNTDPYLPSIMFKFGYISKDLIKQLDNEFHSLIVCPFEENYTKNYNFSELKNILFNISTKNVIKYTRINCEKISKVGDKEKIFRDFIDNNLDKKYANLVDSKEISGNLNQLMINILLNKQKYSMKHLQSVYYSINLQQFGAINVHLCIKETQKQINCKKIRSFRINLLSSFNVWSNISLNHKKLYVAVIKNVGLQLQTLINSYKCLVDSYLDHVCSLFCCIFLF